MDLIPRGVTWTIYVSLQAITNHDETFQWNICNKI